MGSRREEESIGRSGHKQKFEAIIPVPEPRRLESEFGFSISKGHLILPSSGISEENEPSFIMVGDCLISKQISR